MKRVAAIMFICLMFPLALHAETISVKSRDPVFCRLLTRHVPRDDVNYQSGREDVVPADLYSSQRMEISKDVVIPLSVDLAEYFELEVPRGVELKPALGVFRIKSDGRVFWNGRDLTHQAEAYCSAGDKPDKKEVLAEDIISTEPKAPPKQLLDQEDTGLYGAYPEN
jgi:hypothetical protein